MVRKLIVFCFVFFAFDRIMHHKMNQAHEEYTVSMMRLSEKSEKQDNIQKRDLIGKELNAQVMPNSLEIEKKVINCVVVLFLKNATSRVNFQSLNTNYYFYPSNRSVCDIFISCVDLAQSQLEKKLMSSKEKNTIPTILGSSETGRWVTQQMSGNSMQGYVCKKIPAAKAIIIPQTPAQRAVIIPMQINII